MGSKKDLRAELEVLRKELSSTQLKLSFSQSAVDHWVGAAAAKQDRMTELEAELRTEKAKPKFIGNTIIGDRADKKIIDNQKATILDLTKQVDGLTVDCDALKFLVSELKYELYGVKAKPSLVIPDSDKVASLEQEIRSLNLYITRLTNQLDNIRLAAR